MKPVTVHSSLVRENANFTETARNTNLFSLQGSLTQKCTLMPIQYTMREEQQTEQITRKRSFSIYWFALNKTSKNRTWHFARTNTHRITYRQKWTVLRERKKILTWHCANPNWQKASKIKLAQCSSTPASGLAWATIHLENGSTMVTSNSLPYTVLLYGP